MYIKTFKQISKTGTLIAGGKGASLGEMTQAGIPVPDGFVILSNAFDRFIKKTDLNVEIDAVLDSVDIKEVHTFENASEKIRAMILSKEMPEDIKTEILKFYKKLDCKFVAVRSSATSEDSASAAWAGQLDSFLNTTEETLLENVKKCWASLFTPRAIFYRFEKKLNKDNISVAVVIQKMVDSEKSGIAFSVHPVTQDKNQIIIEAGFGLGEAIVSGQITPDSYVVDKQDNHIIDINVNEQEKGLFRKNVGGNEWKELGEKGKNQVLTEKEIVELSKIILKIEKNYNFAVDIEWAKEEGKFYIVQSRPITTLSKKQKTQEKSIDYFITTQYEGFPQIWLADLFFNEINRKTIKKMIGYLPSIFHISYKDNGKDYYIAIQDEKGVELDKKYGESFWKNEKNYVSYKNDIRKIIRETHDIFLEYKKSFSERKIEKRSKKEIAEFLSKIYRLNSFGTAIHYITEEKLVEPLNSQIIDLEKEVPREYVTIADYLTSSNIINNSINKLLADSQKSKNLKKFLEENPSWKKEIDSLIEKYEYIDWTLLGGDMISWDTVFAKYEEAKKDSNELNKIKKMIDKNKELEKKIEHKKEFYKKLKGKKKYMFDLISNLGYYRFENQNRTLILTRIIKEIIEYMRVNYKIPEKELDFYKISELVELAVSSKRLEEPILDKRKKGWAYILRSDKIAPTFLTADKFDTEKDIRTILDYIEKQKKESGKNLKGAVASFPDKKEKTIEGEAYVVKDFYNPEAELKKMPKNKIMVITQTYPNYVPYMKLAKAIVTEVGGLTSHAAIVCREMKKPCIIGVKFVTKNIKTGNKVKLDLESGLVIVND